MIIAIPRSQNLQLRDLKFSYFYINLTNQIKNYYVFYTHIAK